MKIGELLKHPDKQGWTTLKHREARVGGVSGMRKQKQVMQQGKFRKFCHGLKETV